METIPFGVMPRARKPILLTSSEVELMETVLQRVPFQVVVGLLTSSEVELMETSGFGAGGAGLGGASDFLGS